MDLTLLSVCLLALFQGAPGSREATWPAPTAEDWKKPVPITFQRTWEDAVAVSRETGKPILICVNMDGEIASEHYAGIRYRQPDIAALYEPYVCVIASTYRHNPRDFDEEGRRIICPRFGSVTCGEHIWIEPELYQRFMEGKRIAPRHIMVELDGKETYDVYYAMDTASVFRQIGEGISNREATPRPIVRGDRTLLERVASRETTDRSAVEKAYLEGDNDTRKALLEEALKNVDKAPVDLLRLAIFGLDPEKARLAREALARSDSTNAVDLINEALAVPLDEEEKQALISALGRLGESSAKARSLAVVHQGLESRSGMVDVEGWSAKMQGGSNYAPAQEWADIEASILEGNAATSEEPLDADGQLDLAEASLALAVNPKTEKILSSDHKTASKFSRLMFEDALRAAQEAEKLGASGWRLHAVIGLTSFYLGDVEEAYSRAEKAAPDIPAGSEEWSAVSTLALFAQARQRAITRAIMKKENWPGQWLTDMNAAYSVLARHPMGTDAHIVAHYDFLKWLRARRRSRQVLEQGLERFPESWLLHDRLRDRLLKERGVDGLEAAYEEMMGRENASPNLQWFAGYTSIVAAEFHRRAGRNEIAAKAYERSLDHFAAYIQEVPEQRSSADHYAALAIAGQARLKMLAGDLTGSLDLILVSFQRKPEAAGTLDGLNISPVDTALFLKAKFLEAKQVELADKLESALGELDPETLLLPAFEGLGPDGQRRRRPGR